MRYGAGSAATTTRLKSWRGPPAAWRCEPQLLCLKVVRRLAKSPRMWRWTCSARSASCASRRPSTPGSTGLPCATRCGLKKRRDAGAAETPFALLPGAEEPPAPERIDRDTVLAARAALASALGELPPKQRLALALRYVHDLSDAEIAAALGCRTGTVHALLSRGRSALRRDQQLAELALAFEGG